MKRSWISGITAVAVIGVLTLFLALQFSWLTEASEATRERMKRRVEEDTRRVAADFNREMQAAFFNFQADADDLLSGDVSELAERYDYWKSNTGYPGLIRDVYFVPPPLEGEAKRFDPASRTLTPANGDGEVGTIAQLAWAVERPNAYDDVHCALLVPLYREQHEVHKIMIRERTPAPVDTVERFPKAAAHILVLLDRGLIREKILPEIAARHIPAGEFGISVMDRGGQPVFQTGTASGTPDAQAGLFQLAPDNLIFFSKREPGPKNEGATTVFSQTIESETVAAEKRVSSEETGRTFAIQMKDGDGIRRSAVISGRQEDDGPWRLSVQHSAGSIDDFVNGERNKSIAIGLGVYLALAAGILAIVISSQRSWNAAQRQIDFVSSVSHEFRTPIAVIYSAGENLADGVAQEQGQVSRYGHLIKDEGKKLSAMVEQILEFAGARSGKRKYNFEAVDIADVLRDAVERSKNTLDSKGFEVECSIPDQLVIARGDAAALSGSFSNLIQNAIKYSNGQTKLRISASDRGEDVDLTFEDTGIGISKSDQRRIFEPFFRSKKVVDAQIHGNGLGLALVKEIVTAHKGTVTVRSEPGKGSTFVVTLPRT